MTKSKLPVILMGILALTLVFNQWQMSLLHQLMKDNMPDNVANAQEIPASQTAAASVDLTALAKQILPFGIPPVYGAELKISFDDPVTAIEALAPHEQDIRPVKLTGEKLERYIRIGQMTSCEFCCGATTMVFPDGRKACACAHSAAMRGVVAYLLENTDLTDQQILNEANKWKAVFFPGPMVEKIAIANGLIKPATTGAQQSGLQQQVGGC